MTSLHSPRKELLVLNPTTCFSMVDDSTKKKVDPKNNPMAKITNHEHLTISYNHWDTA